MRTSIWLALPMLLELLGQSAWAIGPGNCGPSCIYQPPLNCPDHCDPFANRKNLNIFGPAHAQELIAALKDPANACVRAKAAKKLGCRFHADICHDAGVLQALLDAILFDPCWEVRKDAIHALYWQRACSKDAFMVMYVAWILDPHYMVRDAANDVAFELAMCGRFCWQPDYNAWSHLVTQLRRVKFRPGECDSHKLWDLALASWKSEMDALTAQGISGKELPDVTTPRIGPPVISGQSPAGQPPPPPASRAHPPVPHKCEDGHHDALPIATVPGGVPTSAVPQTMPAGTMLPAPAAGPEGIPAPKSEAK